MFSINVLFLLYVHLHAYKEYLDCHNASCVIITGGSAATDDKIRSSDNDSTGFRPPGSLHTLGADAHI